MQTGTSQLINVKAIDSNTRQVAFEYPNVDASTVKSRVRPMGVTEVTFTDEHGQEVHHQGDFQLFGLAS